MSKKNAILVTGACGTIGAELVRQLLEQKENKVTELIAIDNSESELFFLEQLYLDDKRLQCFLADIRDRDRMEYIMKEVDIVFHAAALKHVVLCERSPFEAVQSNINGVNNIIHAATVNKVSKVIFTSSDKAVNPTNVMGTSKLMGERLITAANSATRNNRPIFASTRFGNVLGSSGSVLPIFHAQIKKGGPVTVTDPDMTRFVMSVNQAVKLVIDSAHYARGGEVFITKMPVVRIEDLAIVMIQELAPRYGFSAKDIEIKVIGCKPGEKLYEELMSDEEIRRAVELKDYFSVLPAFRGIYRNINYDYSCNVVNEVVTNPYISAKESPLTKDELLKFLRDNSLLSLPEDSMFDTDSRYWPGDKA